MKNIKYISLFLSIVLTANVSFAQNKKNILDSLSNVLKSAKEDTTKVNTLNEFSNEISNTGKYDSAIACATSAQALAEKLRYKKGIGDALRTIGNAYCSKGNYPSAVEYLLKAMTINQQIGNKTDIAGTFANIAYTYWCETKYSDALENYNKALDIDKEAGNKYGSAAVLGNIGLIYYELGNYPKALDHEFKALTMNQEIGHTAYEVKNLGNIGLIYDAQGNFAQALEYDNKSLIIEEKKGDMINISADLCNMGGVYAEQGNLDKALEYYNKALGIARDLKNNYGIASLLDNIGSIYATQANRAAHKHAIAKSDSLYKNALENFTTALTINRETGNMRSIPLNLENIGSTYTRQGKFILAKVYLDSSLTIAISIANKDLIKTAYNNLAILDSAIGNYKASLHDYKEYITYRDSLVNEANTKKTVQEEMNYEFDQKQAAEKAEQDKKDAVAASDKRRQNIVIASISLGLILVIVFAFVLFNRFRITQQQKKIIEEQKLIVEEKNKDITDSIHYASRIQRALLTTDSYIGQHLKEHFILFKPKDIVSGDFYWANEVDTGHFLICAGDCTGHSVPGAFMSLLNISMLNETTIEKRIHSPAAILNDVREHIIKALNPEGTDAGSKDGMDCVLCSFDFANNKVDFACANNPLWIIRGAELIEFKPDKMPVGIQGEKHIPFTLQSAPIQKGDMIYIFTDGYADQFGGPKGKKFKYKALSDKLKVINDKPMEKQKQELETAFEEWKGGLEQVDDVLVIGIRV